MKNLDGLNILIVGVGGQGTLLASKFLGAAAALCGKDVKVSEVHGMSQGGKRSDLRENRKMHRLADY